MPYKSSKYAASTQTSDSEENEETSSDSSNSDSSSSASSEDSSILTGRQQGSEKDKMLRFDKSRYKKLKSTEIQPEKTVKIPKRPLPTTSDIYFVDPERGNKKSFGPFSDNPTNPYYFPAIHQITDNQGKKMLDDNFRFHPQFLAEMAKNGGFYRRKIITPPNRNGRHVIEEQFGFAPKNVEDKNKNTDEDDESSSEDSESEENRYTGRKTKNLMRSYLTGPINQYYDPKFGRKTDIELLKNDINFRLQNMFLENKRIQENQSRKYDNLRNTFIRTADQLDNNIHHSVLGGIRSQINELDNAIQSKKDRAYTDKQIKKSKNGFTSLLKMHPAFSFMKGGDD
ncbi:hypothetical protein NUSPORA_00964 [Nucleospora cyclopteri]